MSVHTAPACTNLARPRHIADLFEASAEGIVEQMGRAALGGSHLRVGIKLVGSPNQSQRCSGMLSLKHVNSGVEVTSILPPCAMAISEAI